MKKLALASAVAALSLSAHAAPTVYGQAFLTVDVDETKTKKVTGTQNSKGRAHLNSNTSRIGLRGVEALNPTTNLVYQLEYGIDIDADNNGKNQFYARDTYLGLQHAQYGTLVAGRLTSIDENVDYASVNHGAVLGGTGIQAKFDAPRANNTIAYTSPALNNGQTKVHAMYVLDEKNDTNSLERDAAGIAVEHTVNPALRAGASYIQSGKTAKIARVSAAYDVNPQVTVGALYQIHDINNAPKKENAATVSATYKTATPWTAYTQLDLVKNYAGANNDDVQRLTVGGRYAFNANTTGHLYGAYRNQETDVSPNKTETSGLGIGGGVQYKF